MSRVGSPAIVRRVGHGAVTACVEHMTRGCPVIAPARPQRWNWRLIMASLDNQLCFAIYSTEHAFGRAYKSLLDPLGITYPQYLALLVLWTEDDQTVSKIGDKLQLESNTLTPLLKRLEAQGLISRHRDRTDERQVRIRLTDAGRSLGVAARDVPSAIQKATGLSSTAQDDLRALIGTVRKNLMATASRSA